ncbi:hypothetical protein VMUT_0711 [Vulcanisaeta moutnovskia 768-28]|uniref:Uncharacterized protein n=1 Tax=Vulcanisaeta moutnovskia (strain 768-28) TaxID=985053 RepID=F0QVZ8_VULM7|nr:hypothetical protein [Vulcanisaeta moutnovskia]ADY00922.1 hypothetical protein VMUT_0711 [Vulcanisaeta moutnovskia 768-28]
MYTFKISRTPAVLVIGRVGKELAVWSIDGTITTLGSINGIELVDELKVERQIVGHVAIASFGQYIIKAMDMGSKYGSYTLSEDSLVRIPSRGGIDLRKYNDWVTIRNAFILIGDPNSNYSDYYPLICPYRVGDTLFINTGYTSTGSIRVVLTILGILRNYADRGRVNASCMCRIPSMPLEIALMNGDKYLLIRTHLNEGQASTGNKYLVLLTKGGNVISKYSLNDNPTDIVVKMLNEMRSI